MVIAWSILAVFLVPFFFGGGFSTSWKIGEIVKSIPTWAWITIGVLFLLNALRKKK